MGENEIQLRAIMHLLIMKHVTQGEDRRQEALREYFGVMLPDVSTVVVEHVSSNIPPLLPKLYGKWVELFAERLFETVPVNQIEVLCDRTPDNTAALILAFIMFLESERMEKQIPEDLKSCDFGADIDAEEAARLVLSLSRHLAGVDDQGQES